MDFVSLIGTKADQGSIRNWVNSDKVPAEEILADAENWIEQVLRVEAMTKRLPISLSDGQSEVLIGSEAKDFLDPRILWLNGSGEVYSIPLHEMDFCRAVDEDGALARAAPERYAMVGRQSMLFDYAADRAYSLVFTYYARPPALGVGQRTNLYTTSYRALFRNVCMGLSYLFLKDEGRASQLLQLAAGQVEQISETDDLAQRGMRYDTRVG